MLEPFESHAHDWIKRHEKAVELHCQKSFAETPSSQSNLERFIRSAAAAKPPIILPSFAHESYLRACSENLLEDDHRHGEGSLDLDPNLIQSIPIPLGSKKLLPLPAPYLQSDDDFERQDTQVVHTKFETISNTFIGIGGHLYQLREVIDYWLPKQNPSVLELSRLKWWPSQLIEQARLRTIHEMNSIQISFTDNLLIMNNAICELREGAFGGRLNTKSVVCAKQMFDKLQELRRMILRMQRPATARSRSLHDTSTWLSEKCLGPLSSLQEPYQAERFDRNDRSQAHLGELFHQHCSAIRVTIKFLSEAFQHLSEIFKTIDSMCKTMVEGLYKLMLEVHLAQTTGEFIAWWANRWERVTFALLVRVLGLPAINVGLQRDFPTMEVEFVDLQ